MTSKPPSSIAPSQTPPSAPPNPALESPIRWKVVAQVGGALVVLWVVSAMIAGYFRATWLYVIPALLTAAVAGLGIYIWRYTKKTQRFAKLIVGATDDASRKAALAELAAGDSKDAMNGLARAQLLMYENPSEALAVLEAIDIAKAPVLVQDEVRANLGLVYLTMGRTKDARSLADAIKMDRQPNAKSKAIYAAVIAEANARTGNPAEAKKLLETFSPDDESYGEARALLLRAQVYATFATKNRGLARKAMEKLAMIEPNALGSFVTKGAHPELGKLAREVLAATGNMPRTKMKMIMR